MIEVTRTVRGQALAALACLSLGALALPASGEAKTGAGAGSTPGMGGGRPSSSRNAKVACTPIHSRHLRCTMTIKGGSGISGTVTMRVSRAGVLFASGRGHVASGSAVVTMRVLHPMKPAAYTVKMVIRVHAAKVLRLK